MIFHAIGTRLNITFSYDMCDDECQALEELEVHTTSHLVEVGPEEDLLGVRQARSKMCPVQTI